MTNRRTYHRKVIRIAAEDSPNVQLAMEEIARGQSPSGRTLIPGVLSWQEYQTRKKTWDPVRQCIGLSGLFWEGKEFLLYPPDWRSLCEETYRKLPKYRRKARAIGIDSGAGEANTSWSIVDEYGLIDLRSYQTPNTSVVTGRTLELADRYQVPPEFIGFDAGGGGREHAHRLQSQGFDVRVIDFGGAVTYEQSRVHKTVQQRQHEVEDRAAYTNKRSQMAAELSELMDPGRLESGELWQSRSGLDYVGYPQFALPPARGGSEDALYRLHFQLALIPRMIDGRGRIYLPPKYRRSADSKEVTLVDIIGYSPDEFDSLIVAVHCMLHPRKVRKAGGLFVDDVR